MLLVPIAKSFGRSAFCCGGVSGDVDVDLLLLLLSLFLLQRRRYKCCYCGDGDVDITVVGGDVSVTAVMLKLLFLWW